MSRIRTVKPSFWRSQTLSRVSRDARLVFVGLWNEADDEGRLVDAPKLLAGALFPFDEDFGGPEIEACLRELAGIGAIERYAVEGSRFITIPRFRDHQVISKPRPSALPGHSRNVPGGLPEASQWEWNGMEWKRKRKWKWKWNARLPPAPLLRRNHHPPPRLLSHRLRRPEPSAHALGQG